SSSSAGWAAKEARTLFGRMTEQEVFVLADRTLNDVVARIADDQWDLRMPASFVRSGTSKPPTLREIVNYHGYDDAEIHGDLVSGLWEELSPVADEWREFGAFPPRVEVADDAPLH